MEFEVEKRLIGDGHPPLIVAELSANHGQSYEKALRLIHEAGKAGADVVKFQAYTPDSMTVNCNKPAYLHSEESLWKEYSLYQLYQKASTPYDWFESLFKEVRQLGMIPLSSVFDEESVDFLENLGAPWYKIATLEIVHHPLIKKVAKTKKPIILSTGASTIAEIQEAVDVIRSTGNEKIILLKCISAYPAPINESNLVTIPDIKKRFNTLVGLSDHTVDTLTSILSIALGCTLIEKHFTLSRDDQEIDSAFSLEPAELRQLVRDSKLAYQAGGTVHYGPTLHEKDNFKFRRSLICTRPIKKGDLLTSQNIKALRPDIGLHPKYYESVLGKKATKDLEIGDPILWEVIN